MPHLRPGHAILCSDEVDTRKNPALYASTAGEGGVRERASGHPLRAKPVRERALP